MIHQSRNKISQSENTIVGVQKKEGLIGQVIQKTDKNGIADRFWLLSSPCGLCEK